MNQKILIAIVAFALVVAAIVAAFSLGQRQQPPTAIVPPAAIVTATPPVGTKFDEAGVLALSSGKWQLIYARAGKSSLTVPLVFNSTSICTVGLITKPCAQMNLTISAQARVTGVSQDNTVTVSTMHLIAPQSVLNTQAVLLYFYNAKKDQQGTGNPECSTNAVEPVPRQITRTQTPIQDTIRLLIEGKLTDAEKAQGFQTEFPNAGFALKGAALSGGVLTLEFKDAAGFTSGGSCRVTLLASQITKTALQFSGVNRVVFKPDTLFQP